MVIKFITNVVFALFVSKHGLNNLFLSLKITKNIHKNVAINLLNDSCTDGKLDRNLKRVALEDFALWRFFLECLTMRMP